jgi:hypothetical protein
MDKEIRAQRIAAKVNAVESKIDDTLALAAELMIEMRGACEELNLAAQTSDGAFAKLIEAMGELQAARTAVVATHKRMEKIRGSLGIRITSYISPNKIDTDSEETSASSVRRTA